MSINYLEHLESFKIKFLILGYDSLVLETIPDMRDVGLCSEDNKLVNVLSESELKQLPNQEGVYEANIFLDYKLVGPPDNSVDYEPSFIFKNINLLYKWQN